MRSLALTAIAIPSILTTQSHATSWVLKTGYPKANPSTYYSTDHNLAYSGTGLCWLKAAYSGSSTTVLRVCWGIRSDNGSYDIPIDDEVVGTSVITESTFLGASYTTGWVSAQTLTDNNYDPVKIAANKATYNGP